MRPLTAHHVDKLQGRMPEARAAGTVQGASQVCTAIDFRLIRAAGEDAGRRRSAEHGKPHDADDDFSFARLKAMQVFNL